jgi:branched-chain amino acid transport system permease protein
MESILQYIVIGLMNGGLYAFLAVGIVLVYKSTAVFNFAMGQMLMLGAFFLWSFTSLGLPIWISILLCLACGALMGLLIERFTMRPLIGQPLISAVLATLALSYILDALSKLVWGAASESLPKFLPGKSIQIGNIVFAHDLLWVFAIALAAVLLLFVFYQRTRIGLSMRAVAESHKVAEARGIRIRNIFSVTWALAGIVAVAGGMLLGYRLGVTQFLSIIGLKAFPVVLFGGMDSIPGVLVAGLIVGVLESLAGGLVGSWLMGSMPYIVLLLALIFKPYGLFGLSRIERI